MHKKYIEIKEFQELKTHMEKKLTKYYDQYLKYDNFVYFKYLCPTKRTVNSEKTSSHKTLKKIIQPSYYNSLHTIHDIHELLGDSFTFFENILDYLTENHTLFMDLVEKENLSKVYEIEKLFIHIYHFYYINSYETKDNKELLLSIMVEMIELELKNCDKLEDLFNRNNLVQKILFSFLNKPSVLKYSIRHIRLPFFKILQELEYSDLEKLMDIKNVEKILEEFFSIILSTSQKIPFLIKFFCYACFRLAQQKVKNSFSIFKFLNFFKKIYI